MHSSLILSAVLMMALTALSASAEVATQKIEYKLGDAVMEG